MKLTRSQVNTLQNVTIPEIVKHVFNVSDTYLSKHTELKYQIEDFEGDPKTREYLRLCMSHAEELCTIGIAHYYDRMCLYGGSDYGEHLGRMVVDLQKMERGIGWLKAALQYIEFQNEQEETKK